MIIYIWMLATMISNFIYRLNWGSDGEFIDG